MLKKLFLWSLVAVAVIFLAGCGRTAVPDSAFSGGTALAQVSPPALPAQPEKIDSASSERVIASKSAVQIHLNAGWNIISFPFKNVTSCSGFTYKIYKYNGTGYDSINPITQPDSIDCHYGYWAYTVNAADVTVDGTANTGSDKITSVDLSYGWNFIGFPFSSTQYFSVISVRRNSETRTLADASSGSVLWLYNRVYEYGSGSWISQLTSQPGNSFVTGKGYMLWCWMASTLQFSDSSHPLTLSSISPSVLLQGGTVVLTGSGFGSIQATGSVRFNGLNASSVASWSDTRIVCKVPSGAASGDVLVANAAGVSNSQSYTVSTTGITGRLTGGSGIALNILATFTAISGGVPGSSNAYSNPVDGTYAIATAPGVYAIFTISASGYVDATAQGTTPTTGNVAPQIDWQMVGSGGQAPTFTIIVGGGATPVLETVSPSVVLPGSTVKLTGSGFGNIQGTGNVRFNGSYAVDPSISWSDTQIICKVPPGATSGNAIVTTPGGSSDGVAYTVAASGTALSGRLTRNTATPLSVLGTFFTVEAPTVPAAYSNPVDGTFLIPVSPAAYAIFTITASGYVDATAQGTTPSAAGNVAVQNDWLMVATGGQAPTFAIVPGGGGTAPVLSSMTPSVVLHGSTVVLGGSGFGNTQGTSTVSLGGTSVTSIASWADNQIICKVPEGAVSGTAAVTVSGGTSNAIAYTLATTGITGRLTGGTGIPLNMLGTFYVYYGGVTGALTCYSNPLDGTFAIPTETNSYAIITISAIGYVDATAQGGTPASGTIKAESDWQMVPTGGRAPMFTL
ncbi:MAG: IPT/TIG domain-containing protein [bacterium]